jgi:hypothetical protein
MFITFDCSTSACRAENQRLEPKKKLSNPFSILELKNERNFYMRESNEKRAKASSHSLYLLQWNFCMREISLGQKGLYFMDLSLLPK